MTFKLYNLQIMERRKIWVNLTLLNKGWVKVILMQEEIIIWGVVRGWRWWRRGDA
jgi:hypothetical protein